MGLKVGIEFFLFEILVKLQQTEPVGYAGAVYKKSDPDETTFIFPCGIALELRAKFARNHDRGFVLFRLQLISLPYLLGVANLEFGIVGFGIKRNVADVLGKRGDIDKYQEDD